jgi:hypothetical protein
MMRTRALHTTAHHISSAAAFVVYFAITAMAWLAAVDGAAGGHTDPTPAPVAYSAPTHADITGVDEVVGRVIVAGGTEYESVIPVYACDTDTDCVTKNPRIIPDAHTVRAYWQVWGDFPLFPVLGDCSRVDWQNEHEDGQLFVPVDLNGDGAINWASDLELGA